MRFMSHIPSGASKQRDATGWIDLDSAVLGMVRIIVVKQIVAVAERAEVCCGGRAAAAVGDDMVDVATHCGDRAFGVLTLQMPQDRAEAIVFVRESFNVEDLLRPGDAGVIAVDGDRETHVRNALIKNIRDINEFAVAVDHCTVNLAFGLGDRHEQAWPLPHVTWIVRVIGLANMLRSKLTILFDASRERQRQSLRMRNCLAFADKLLGLLV